MNPITCAQCKYTGIPDSDGHCRNCGVDMSLFGDTSPGLKDADTQSAERENDASIEIPSPREEPPPGLNICLEYQHLYLNAGQHGCIPFKLTNLGRRSIRQIQIQANCIAFVNYTPSAPLSVNLAPDRFTEMIQCDFDIRDKAGPYQVEITGACVDEKNQPLAFRALFKIIVRDPKAKKPKIKAREIYGADLGNIDIEAVEEIQLDEVYGVMLNFNKETGWMAVNLEEDPDRTRLLLESNTPRKPKPPPQKTSTRRNVSPPRAFLAFRDGSGEKTFHIWTGKACRIGRNPEKSDIVCIRLPGNDLNNKANALISQKQCRLKIENRKVIVEDQKSTNGTFVDGRRIDGETALNSGQVISLANKMYLRFHDFRDLNRVREINRAFQNCRTVLECNTALSSLNLVKLKEKAPLQCFLLKRLDDFENRLEYLFLLSSAMIGSSKYAAVFIQDDSVSDQHARMIWIDRQYYVEDLMSEKGTYLNGTRLEPYNPVLLKKESELLFGDVKADFRIPAM